VPAITDTKISHIIPVMIISFIMGIILLAAMIFHIRGIPGLLVFFHR